MVRTKVIEDFKNVFEQVDVLMAPVTPTPAFRLGEKTDDPLAMYLEDVLSVNANLAGIPALCLPASQTRDGLPVGFQIMGPKLSEDLLFDLGEKYQQNNKTHLLRPNL